ncbi:MAG: hypothetical protein LBF67_08765 [Prevotellaceae bacterium]|jgi:TPR repeat protein|nr:hypothetical protein [Prevotellaceae bacterium]
MKSTLKILLGMASAALLWQCGTLKRAGDRQAAPAPPTQAQQATTQDLASMDAALLSDPALQKMALDKAMYAIRNGVAADYPQAFSEATALAAQGNSNALLYAGAMHKFGVGCPRSESAALRCYLAAAEQGSSVAAYNAGIMLRHSDSIAPDFAQSTKWLQKAADLSNPNALYPLGDAHFKGLGTAQSYQAAVATFEQSSDPNATFMLAYCYLNGYGVERNVDKAKELITQAAKRGSRRALDFMLAIRDPAQYSEATTDLDGKPKKFARHAPEVEKRIPEKYATVGNSPLSNSICGAWRGALVTYDYGKGEIVNNEALTLELTLNGNELYGIWTDGVKRRPPLALRATFADSAWVFADSVVRNPDPFAPQTLQTARLQYGKDSAGEFLLGNLQMLLMEFREYEQPTMLALVKDAQPAAPADSAETGDKAPQPQNVLRAYPNPFSAALNVELQLDKPCKLSVTMYAAGGAQVYSLPVREYPAGTSVEAIATPLATGMYLVRVEGDAHLAAWVVKK